MANQRVRVGIVLAGAVGVFIGIGIGAIWLQAPVAHA